MNSIGLPNEGAVDFPVACRCAVGQKFPLYDIFDSTNLVATHAIPVRRPSLGQDRLPAPWPLEEVPRIVR